MKTFREIMVLVLFGLLVSNPVGHAFMVLGVMFWLFTVLAKRLPEPESGDRPLSGPLR